MRLITLLILGCCSLGYSEESTETPAEITTNDEIPIVEVFLNKSGKPTGGGCGCGKPKQ